ncbi:phage major capsid protein [Candidatus Borkfalkia ceftriaxoniphila]|uniref:Phage major capsid protein n=1 Tax=Candidatus Borkfalkia ceftriaxoniphila TaxID=2508949 RepID=A0A4Q2KEA8_9FIRM|nr:phage major capsid protein [Candidatus Borkfalkia ceftriaxoniphila]RXZ62240.1 phage major capsid protein [Candidatus Borkfalkia ceftriaxoniphila]DAP57523.1 MAG TPA: major capsid protein [Caudoviricetes sp.]
MVTMTSADNALKSVYLGAVSEQLDTAINPLLAKIQRSTADVWGKEVRRLAQYGVNGGVGAGTEEGDLPSAAGNNYEQFVTTLKNLYGTIEISDKAVRASENNVGAFVNLLNAEMDGLIRSSAFNFGRMLFGDGSGVLCKVVSVSGNTVTADGVKNLIEGMVVDVLAAGGAPISGAKGRRVVAVDRAAKTFTLSGDALTGVAKDNLVCVQGSYNLELTGLGAIFKDTGSLYGLDRATHKWMIPYMQSSVGTLSETVMQKAIDWLEERAGSRVDFIVCSWGVKRALQNLLSENRRSTDVEVLAGGYKAMTYNGIPVVADRFCPDGTMYLLNTSDFCLHQLCDWKWLEGDDGKVLKQIAGKPLYTATLVKYADLVCARPCGQAMLTGITEA